MYKDNKKVQINEALSLLSQTAMIRTEKQLLKFHLKLMKLFQTKLVNINARWIKKKKPVEAENYLFFEEDPLEVLEPFKANRGDCEVWSNKAEQFCRSVIKFVLKVL